MKILVAIAVISLSSLVGCEKAKRIEPTASAGIVEPQSISSFRARASELNLKWYIRCDDSEVDGSDAAFWGLVWPKGFDYHDVPTWTATGKSQEEVAEKLLYALRYKPNTYPSDWKSLKTSPKKRNGFCPPELHGE